ncbi:MULTISPECIES: transcriptional regulator [Actinomycetes]|uniref:GAF domain-containing protein n=2 Tax=Actinomycetes TaxID=1760 RepID=A0ABP6LTN8_9MICC
MGREPVPDEPQTWSVLPPVLRESWLRSASYLDDPVRAQAPIDLDEGDLNTLRREHPLSAAMPLLDRLLVQPAKDAGLVVAIGDAKGRLLWVDGSRQAMRRAETSAFQAGANWSERAVGTSAPGTALATGRAVQVNQEEHFVPAAHQFSCSAAPIRCPQTGDLLGVVDITGGPAAVETHALPLVLAAITAAQGELRSQPRSAPRLRFSVLGSETGTVTAGASSWRLSLRHAELLTLLAWEESSSSGGGASAARLAEDIFGETGHEVALRAEVTRLRRLLVGLPGHADPPRLNSRPYRLDPPPWLDAVGVVHALAAGDRSAALDLYSGELLPRSEAPGIVRIRWELSAMLRESILQDGSSWEICRYLQLPEARGDGEVLREALRVLPPDSPQRALLIARSNL